MRLGAGLSTAVSAEDTVGRRRREAGGFGGVECIAGAGGGVIARCPIEVREFDEIDERTLLSAARDRKRDGELMAESIDWSACVRDRVETSLTVDAGAGLVGVEVAVELKDRPRGRVS